MGSFPSQEQAVHPTFGGASEPDASTSGPTATGAIQQQPPAYPPSSRSGRPSHTLSKKRARGRLLVLGLDGAGKTTVVAHLVRASDEEGRRAVTSSLGGEQLVDEPQSTREYPHASKTHQTSLYKLDRDACVQLIDAPGRREYRRRWYTTGLGAANDVSSMSYTSSLASSGSSSSSAQPLPLLGVVFVIDVSDRVRFPVVAQELVRFQQLKERKKALRKAQLFLLLNKTDLVTAAAAASATESLTLHQQQPQSDQQRHAIDVAKRTAMRAARRELKQCIDHHVRVDQKRNPRAYSPIVHATSAPSTFGHGVVPESSSAMAHTPFGSALRSAAVAAAEASAARTTGMMASILECCAHDRASGSAIHGWLKDEIKKAL